MNHYRIMHTTKLSMGQDGIKLSYTVEVNTFLLWVREFTNKAISELGHVVQIKGERKKMTWLVSSFHVHDDPVL